MDERNVSPALRRLLEDAEQEQSEEEKKIEEKVARIRRSLESLYAGKLEEERKRLLREFLEVADNLERALEHSRGLDKPLEEGIRLTLRALMKALEREGVLPMETAEGKPFDPEIHEAVGVDLESDAKPSHVVGEIQRGYTYKGETLRPAKVIVKR